MKTSGNTVLITGGATGIGLALAKEFVDKGNHVIICGRREQKLNEAKEKMPQIDIKVCDLSKARERERLFKTVESEFNGVNILVNNAGIQRPLNFKKGASELNGESEIEINLVAPIELSAHFIPSLMKKEESAIINISSGLGFVPISLFPIYCATKAAIHSFSISLRHQLRDTPVRIFEIIVPTTDTELDKGMRAKRGAPQGIPSEEVATAIMKALENNEFEAAVGEAQNLKMGSRNNPEQIFKNMNERLNF